MSDQPDTVLVPRDPTEAMLKAGALAAAEVSPFKNRDQALAVYRAMISQAPAAGGGEVERAFELLEQWGDNWIIAKGQTRPDEPPYGCQLLTGEEVCQEGEGDTLLAAVNAAFDEEDPGTAAHDAIRSGSLS